MMKKRTALKDNPPMVRETDLSSPPARSEKSGSAAVNSPPSVDEYAERIELCRQKGLEGDLEMADICADAQKRLSPEALKALRTKMFKSKSEWSKYSTVGSDARFKEPSIRSLLPQGIERLHAVSQLDGPQLEEARKKGLLSPKVTRAALDNFRKGRPPTSSERRFAIQYPKTYAIAQEEELITLLKTALRDWAECEVVVPKRILNERADKVAKTKAAKKVPEAKTGKKNAQ